ISDGLRRPAAGDRAVADGPGVGRHGGRTGRGITGRAGADLSGRRRDGRHRRVAIDDLFADGDVVERRRDGGVGGGEERFVLQVALAVELGERGAAGGEEGRGGAVRADEAEWPRGAVAGGDLEPDRRVRGGDRGPGERGPVRGGAGDRSAVLRGGDEVSRGRVDVRLRHVLDELELARRTG